MTLTWEKIKVENVGVGRLETEIVALMARAKVPGGWLIAVNAKGMTFFPDPNHVWDGNLLA